MVRRPPFVGRNGGWSSEEVVWCPPRDVGLSPPGRWVELEAVWRGSGSAAHGQGGQLRGKYVQHVLHVFVKLHNSGLVATAVAVVGRGEDGHDVLLVAPVVAFHDELMSAGDEVEAVVVIELLRNVLPESVAGSSRGGTPAGPVVGVGPEEVAHGAFVGHLLDSVELAYVVESINGGRKAAVEAENLLLNESGEREVVEEVREELPHVGAPVLAKALVIEPIPAQPPAPPHR